jgi:hypothetical protein
MAKFPTRRETQEWRKNLVRELAREFPASGEEDEERFKAALGARVEKDPEARTMVYAAFVDHVMSEWEREQGRKGKPGPKNKAAKKKAAKNKATKQRAKK